MSSTPEKSKAETVAGIAVLLAFVTGVASLVVAVFSFFSANWVGAGTCLVAAALAFGLVANAVLRH